MSRMNVNFTPRGIVETRTGQGTGTLVYGSCSFQNGTETKGVHITGSLIASTI